MSWIEIVTLSIVQGITEFLPVSSSAHLIFVPQLFGWSDQGPSFDIAVHVGTLLAVITYFRIDLLKMSKSFGKGIVEKKWDTDAKLLWSIGFATIPVGLCGLFFKNFIQTSLRSSTVIIISTIFFALLLWVADWKGKQTRGLKKLGWKDVCWIGIGQALSLIPGASRSGVTLTFGLFQGLTRQAAARFSFLLSIPVIVLAGGLEAYGLLKHPVAADWWTLGMGACLSGISGFFCIHYFLKILQTVGLMPFILYRLCLGGFLLYIQ